MGFSAQHLSAVERGEASVSEQFVQACDDALGADGRLVELLPPVVFERARARWSNRAARDSVAMRLPSPRAPSPAPEPGATQGADPTRSVASADAQVIAEMIYALRRVDNRFGGAGTPRASCWAISTDLARRWRERPCALVLRRVADARARLGMRRSRPKCWLA